MVVPGAGNILYCHPFLLLWDFLNKLRKDNLCSHNLCGVVEEETTEDADV